MSTSSRETLSREAVSRRTFSRDWRNREAPLARWERVTEWPLVGCALLFLAAYAIPIIWPDLNHFLLSYTRQVIIGTWVIFAIDYLIRLHLARNKFAYFRHNIVDLLSIILPVVRPLRLLRLLAALSVLNRFGSMSLRGRVVGYAVAFSAVVTFVGALAVTQAERASGMIGANILTFRDGIWWAFVTLATVGYGDFYPVTNVGRTVAVILMMVGVLLVGAISATLASWLVQHALAREPLAAADEGDDLDLMLQQIHSLNEQVDALSGALERHATNVRAATPRANKSAIDLAAHWVQHRNNDFFDPHLPFGDSPAEDQ